MTERVYAIVPGFEGGWVFKRRYSDRAIKHFRYRREAIAYAWTVKACESITVHEKSGIVLHVRERPPVSPTPISPPRLAIATLAGQMIKRFRELAVDPHNNPLPE